MNNQYDLISRKAAISEIEEYIEEYSDLEPETGYHNLKWCAMEEAKDVLSMLPAADAVPVEWLRNLCTIAEMETDDKMFIDWLIQTWKMEQEAQDG